MASGIALLLVFSGGGLVGVALASQREAPQPPAGRQGRRVAQVAEPTAQPQAAPTPVGAVAAATAVAPPTLVQSDPPTTREGKRWRQRTVARISTAARAPLTLPRSLPATLDIPAIGVRSVVHALGQTDSGALETPPVGPTYNDAAWYRYSPAPGSLGPSILLGHVDSAADGPSVFFRLGEVQKGDRVRVTRADGTIAVFAVDRVRRYAKDDFPTRLVYSNTEHAALRIVTCGGAFDDASGHYLDNVVVFASLIDSAPAPTPTTG